MKYQFPVIKDIEQVRAAIEWHKSLNDGKTEFIEAQRDGFIVFNYLVNMPGTFPATNDSEHAAVLRELRGLTFYEGGTVAARKFHKFFNLGERSETDFPKVDWAKGHVILEKLDGSMITPFLRDDKIEWHTKMGATDVADFVKPFIAKNEQYAECALDLLSIGHTPIFEFCSRKNRIVIDHPKDRLVLLAVRDNVTGSYYNYDELQYTAKTFGLELVRQYEGNVENMKQFIEEARDEQDIEGYVIRFDDGHMLKIKADVYVTLHKAVSQLQQEKDVWRLILEDKVDDLKAILMDDQRDRLDEFQSDLMSMVYVWVRKLKQAVGTALDELDQEDFSMFDNPDSERKKMFAVKYVQGGDLDSRIRNLMFAMYDDEQKDAFELVRDFLIKQTSTGTKVDKVRDLMGGVEWKVTEE